MEPKIITVEAQPGRTVPLHPEDQRQSVGVHFLKPGERCEVLDTSGIRRRIRAGDLEIVKPGEPQGDSGTLADRVDAQLAANPDTTGTAPAVKAELPALKPLDLQIAEVKS